MDNEIDDTGITPEAQAPAVDSSATTTTEETHSKEIMIPKSRFDEVNDELKRIRNAPKQTEQKQNVEEIVARELAPLRIELETERVMRKYDDFDQFAPGALAQIKSNPSLKLEDAYKLTKFEHLQSKAKEEGKKEAYQTIEKKENLSFESSGVKTASKPIDEILRDKSVSLSEIAKMLPRG